MTAFLASYMGFFPGLISHLESSLNSKCNAMLIIIRYRSGILHLSVHCLKGHSDSNRGGYQFFQSPFSSEKSRCQLFEFIQSLTIQGNRSCNFSISLISSPTLTLCTFPLIGTIFNWLFLAIYFGQKYKNLSVTFISRRLYYIPL